jgi:hypothetical protein
LGALCKSGRKFINFYGAWEALCKILFVLKQPLNIYQYSTQSALRDRTDERDAVTSRSPVTQ